MDSKTMETMLIAAGATALGMILYDVLAPKIKKALHIQDFEADLI